MKYKKLIQLGSTISTESAGSIIPLMPVDGEYTDMTLSDLRDAEATLEHHGLAIENLTHTARKLTKLRESMLSHKEPLSSVSVEAYTAAVNLLTAPMGIQGVVVSVEGFAYDNAASLTYSAEGIKEVLANMLTRLIELITTAIDKAKGYVEKFFDATENLKGRYDNLATKAEGVGGRSITNPNIEVSFTEAQWVMTSNGNVNIADALSVFDKTVTQTLLGYPQDVAKYVRAITAVLSSWVNDPAGAKNADAFNGIQPPPLHGVNPNSGVKEDFNYTPYRIIVKTSGLGSVEFDDAPYTPGEPPESVQIPVLQGQAVLANISVARRVIENTISAKNAIEGMTNTMSDYSAAMEALSKLTIEDDDVATALRDQLVDVNAAVRSWCDFPIRMAAKIMHGVSAAESIMSKMLTEGYGKQETDAGATGSGTGGAQ